MYVLRMRIASAFFARCISRPPPAIINVNTLITPSPHTYTLLTIPSLNAVTKSNNCAKKGENSKEIFSYAFHFVFNHLILVNVIISPLYKSTACELKVPLIQHNTHTHIHSLASSLNLKMCAHFVMLSATNLTA